MKLNSQEYHKPIWQLTVGEYIDLHQQILQAKKYEYGIKGLAKIFGIARSTAYNLKASGLLDEAISQNGKTIIIDVDLALKLFDNRDTSQFRDTSEFKDE